MSVKLNENRFHPNQPAAGKGVPAPPKTVLDGGNPNVNPSLGVVGVAAVPPVVKAIARNGEDPDDGDNTEDRTPRQKVS